MQFCAFSMASTVLALAEICCAKHCCDSQVEEAAKLANAHDFISGFPMGYRTMVGERGQSSSLTALTASVLLSPMEVSMQEMQLCLLTGLFLEALSRSPPPSPPGDGGIYQLNTLVG